MKHVRLPSGANIYFAVVNKLVTMTWALASMTVKMSHVKTIKAVLTLYDSYTAFMSVNSTKGELYFKGSNGVSHSLPG